MATTKKKSAAKAKAKTTAKKAAKKAPVKKAATKKAAKKAPAKKVAQKSAVKKAPTKKAVKKAAVKKAAPKKAAAKKPVTKTVTTKAPARAKVMPTSFTPKTVEGVLPVRLQAVVDKSEIADLLYTVARGLDRIDETLLRSVFHPDATVDMGPGLFQGTGNDYVHWVIGVLGQIRESHHMIANVRVTLEHDVALVESYCHAHFRVDKPTGREDVFIGSRF